MADSKAARNAKGQRSRGQFHGAPKEKAANGVRGRTAAGSKNVIEYSAAARFVELVAEAKRQGIWATIQPKVWEAIRGTSPTLGQLLFSDEVALSVTAMLQIPKAEAKKLAESVLLSRAAIGVQMLEEILNERRRLFDLAKEAYGRPSVLDPEAGSVGKAA